MNSTPFQPWRVEGNEPWYKSPVKQVEIQQDLTNITKINYYLYGEYAWHSLGLNPTSG